MLVTWMGYEPWTRWLAVGLLGGFALGCAGPQRRSPAAQPQPEARASVANAAEATPKASAQETPTRDATPTQGAPQALTPLNNRPDLRAMTLPNGLRVLVLPRNNPTAPALMWLMVNAGAKSEGDDEAGSAALLQHLAFGGDPGLTVDQLRGWFKRVGGQMGAELNSYLNHDEVVYQLQASATDGAALKEGLGILRHWAGELVITEGSVNAARSAARRSLGRGLTAARKSARTQSRALLADTDYAGHEPSVDAKIGADAVRRFYLRQYRPDNAAVVIVGAVDPARTMTMVREVFGGWTAKVKPSSAPRTPRAPPPARFFDPSLHLESAALMLRREATPMIDRASYTRMLTDRLTLRLLNLRFATLKLNDGRVGASGRRWVRALKVWLFTAVGSGPRLSATLAVASRELERARRHGFTPKEVATARSWLLSRIRAAAAAERDASNAKVARGLIRHLSRGDAAMSLQQELALCEALIPKVTADDLSAALGRWLTESKRVITVSAKRDHPSLSLTQLKASAQWPADRPLSPWVDGVPPRELLTKLPAPGAVTERAHRPAEALYRWKLSNGAEVVLKRVPGDKVRLRAISSGGWSLAKDAELPSARAAAAIANRSGAGQWSAKALLERLGARGVTLRWRITQHAHSVDGRAPTDALETLLQGAHLMFGGPRRDVAAARAWRRRREQRIVRRQGKPLAMFKDQVSTFLARRHPRRRPESLAQLAEVKPDAALAFLRARFAHATGFRFVLVGDVAPEALEPLLLRYVSSLPTGQAQRWRDEGIGRRSAGTLTVRSSQTQRAVRLLIFEHEGVTERGVGAWASGLHRWLNEQVKERRSMVSVRATSRRLPQPRTTIVIQLRCPAGAIEAFTSRVLVALQTVRDTGLPVSARTPKQRRSLSPTLNERDLAWLKRLSDLSLSDFSGREVSARGAPPALSQAESKRLAQSLLTPSRYITATLLPK